MVPILWAFTASSSSPSLSAPSWLLDVWMDIRTTLKKNEHIIPKTITKVSRGKLQQPTSSRPKTPILHIRLQRALYQMRRLTDWGMNQRHNYRHSSGQSKRNWWWLWWWLGRGNRNPGLPIMNHRVRSQSWKEEAKEWRWAEGIDLILWPVLENVMIWVWSESEPSKSHIFCLKISVSTLGSLFLSTIYLHYICLCTCRERERMMWLMWCTQLSHQSEDLWFEWIFFPKANGKLWPWIRSIVEEVIIVVIGLTWPIFRIG